MKKIKLASSWLFVGISVVLSGKGESFRADINPALLYYQALLLAPNLPESDYLYIRTNEWRNQRLTERYISISSNYDNEIALLRQAAQQKLPCDWGIDISHGGETLYPQLARAKTAAIDLTWRLRLDLQNEDHATACDDLNATLVLGRNVAHGGPLVSTLVQIAIEAIFCEKVAEYFNHFSPQDCQRLSDGFAAAPPRVTVADCVAIEKTLYPELLKYVQKGHPSSASFIMADDHSLRQSTNGTGQTNEELSKASNVQPLYEQLQLIIGLPHDDYEKQMAKFQEESSFSNYVFSSQIGMWQAGRKKEFRIEVDLAMVHAAIEYKLHGQAGFESVKDPWVNRPFTMQRFNFNGVDRGFKLISAYNNEKGPEIFIFVEKDGPSFIVWGNGLGQPVSRNR